MDSKQVRHALIVAQDDIKRKAMKKVRKIKISATTREILVSRSAAADLSADSNNFSICPVCHSRLSGTLNQPALPEKSGDDAEAAEHFCPETKD